MQTIQTVFEDFHTRVQEVNQYFVFLESLIQETTKLAVSGDQGEQKNHTDWFKFVIYSHS